MVGSGDGAGSLLVPGRPTTLAYGRTRAAVLAAGAGRVGCFFFFFFTLSSLCLICWETAGHSEILWSRTFVIAQR